MNAYELADALNVEASQAEYGYVVDDWQLFSDSAKMLCKQADRLAFLENIVMDCSAILKKANEK